MPDSILPVYQVDAFADRPFTGNPAAVCLLPAPRDAAWMAAVAAEMNLSETAFVSRRDDGFDLRWFTPAVEVDLCGHATLATAHVLWEAGWLPRFDAARFHTRSGLLTANRTGNVIVLDFPANPAVPAEAPPGLIEALGVAADEVALGRHYYLVRLASEADVRGVRPDFGALKAATERGIIVTSPADEAGYDFVSRFFGPALGVDEDPVTGSAHCCLGPYWGSELGKDDMMAFQASARGGAVRLLLVGDRVRLGGRAVTVLRGELDAG